MIPKTLRLSIILMPILSFGQATKFPPRDDSGKDPELNLFVTELKQIIRSKDGQKLIALTHPGFRVGFDEGVGIDKFKKAWTPDDKNSELWTLMDKIVGLGGVFKKNRSNLFYDFVFPYVNDVDLENPDDFFKILVVTGKNVNVREKPDIKSKIVGQLTYDIVKYDYEKSYPKSDQPRIAHVSFYGPKE